jgi:subtilisin family serine protease
MSNKIKMSAVATAVGFAFASHGAIAAPNFDKAFQPELSSTKQYSQEKHVQIKTRYIVQLEDEPLATYSGGVVGFSATSAKSTGNDKLNLKSRAAVTYGDYLKKQQKSVASSIASATGAKSVLSFNTLFNGIVVEGKEGQQAALAALPGVKKVFLDSEYHAVMDASIDIIKGVEAWTELGGQSEAGKGVKVAIIDSGIRPENPMFSDLGMEAPEFSEDELAHLAANPDYCRASTGDASFCNNKLIVARHFGPLTSGMHPDEYMTPLGYDAHGTHVAGTAVGNPVEITYQGSDLSISGVAPAAHLMVYKALWHTTSGRASGRTTGLMQALEAAIKDGADVINNSWGGGAGANPASSAYGDLFKAAEEAGVVVVTAAGNDGNGPQTIGCPGCIESGLTVANTQTGRFFSQTIEIAGESYLSVEGSNGLLSDTIQLPVVAAHFAEPENAEGCNEYSEGVSFADSIAFVSRGSCAFTTKAQNAAKAGAKAIIIHNNAPGGAMGMSMDEAPIPASAVSLEDGEKILEVLKAAEDTLVATLDPTITRTVLEKFTDAVNTSSSRGPNGEPSFLKPDIAAPGTDILSAYSPDEGNGLTFNAISGTSMASPHVAGAAALMKQTKPDWSAVQIKTALMSTSKMNGLHKEDLVTKADAFDVGAGRLDVPSALGAAVTFAKGSYADPSCLSVCSFTNTMTNMMDEAGEWTGKIVTDMDGAEITLSPSTINLTAAGTEGAEATFNLDIDTTYNAVKDWNFGHVVWTHTSGKVAHLPFAVYDNETSNASALVANVDADSLNSQTPANLSVEFTNIAYSGEFNVDIDFTDAVVEESAFAGVGEVTVNPVGNTINWKGSVEKSTLDIVAEDFLGTTSLTSFGIAPVECGADCDEFTITVNAPFKFAGKEYSAFTVSDNGFIAVGADVDTSGSYAPQAMPSQTTPNGVIAPLWADYDLEGGTGGGHLYVGVLTDSAGTKYHIVEWHKIQEYDGDGTEYSFQVIITEGTDQIRINYLDVPKLPASYSAGAETADGTIGDMIEAVPTGAALGKGYIVNQVAGGKVKLDFQVTASDKSHYTSADVVTTDEEQTVNIAVLENDAAESRFKFTANVTSETSTDEYSAGKGVRVTGSLDASSVTVVDAPKFGIATAKEDGTIDYMPAQGFSGSDSFTYTVSDVSGSVSNPTTVSVTVNDTIPTPTPDATPAPKSSSGSLAWLALLATPFAMLRRRKQK